MKQLLSKIKQIAKDLWETTTESFLISLLMAAIVDMFNYLKKKF
ncbi:hypothetical protein [Weissella sagaensis]|jgi:hypothetical protein|uniref:Uncharacterized protein n=1 Tax=Weissella sagaensis TaxID=2559928 RepID=A0ABW1RW14_9LACO|nr:hypothetical protein [Weissella sagaensis]